jgi:hypothetical protein
METLYYDLATQISHMTRSVKIDDDYGGRNATLMAKNIVHRIPDSKPYTKFQSNLIFVDVINYMSLDGEQYSHGQRKCLSFLREIYGDQHLVLSDLC